MTQHSVIDLSALPAPNLTPVLDVETIFAEQKAQLVARYPALADALEFESDILVQNLRQSSYREYVIRRDFNDDARGQLLAFAVGGTLDHIGAAFGVERQTVREADPTATPPVTEIKEDDDRLRRRIQLAPEGITRGGTPGMYEFLSLQASPLVKGVSVMGYQDHPELERGEVRVTVLSYEGAGIATQDLLDIVKTHLWDHRTMGDLLTVMSASILRYDLIATMSLLYGPDEQVVVQAAQEAAVKLVKAQHNLAHDIIPSAIDAALHQPGVHEVTIISPPEAIRLDKTAAAYCKSLQISVMARDV